MLIAAFRSTSVLAGKTVTYEGGQFILQDYGPLTLDQLITNVMIYWVTQSIHTSTWLYTAARLKGGMGLGPGERVMAPTGFLACPHDLFPPPPVAWVRRSYNVVHRTDWKAGGHFAAYERGHDLVADVRSFFRRFRT